MARALGAFLNGKDFASLTGSPALDRLLPSVNLLPRRAREWFYAFSGMVEAIGRGRVDRLDLGRIAAWLVGLYPDRIYPAAFIGSSNGALVHLAAALGAPFLPQTFLCPVRRLGADPDDARAGLAAGLSVAAALAAAHPGIAVHHMHDPNQDRLMLRTMSYFRLKHRRLPTAWRAALIRWLPTGATLYMAECTQAWPVLRTGPRSVFQFGAVGGMEAEEYYRGSARVRAYLARYGVDRDGWDPPTPDDTAPEAEWGFDPALRPELEALARERGWRLVALRFALPEALSEVAARLHIAWYRDLGSASLRLIADSFVLMAPRRAQLLRAVPFWLLFGVEPSAERLARFLDAHPIDRADLFLFSHGTEGVGLAPADTWRRLAYRGRLLGVDPERFPRDFATFARFHRAVAALSPVHEAPPLLPPARFEAMLRAANEGTGVEIAEIR